MRTQKAILACLVALVVYQCRALADCGLAYQQPAPAAEETSADRPLKQVPNWTNEKAESLRDNLHSEVQEAQRTLPERKVVIETAPGSIQQFGADAQQKARQFQQEIQTNWQSTAEQAGQGINGLVASAQGYRDSAVGTWE